jgi:hypothetical protein
LVDAQADNDIRTLLMLKDSLKTQNVSGIADSNMYGEIKSKWMGLEGFKNSGSTTLPASIDDAMLGISSLINSLSMYKKLVILPFARSVNLISSRSGIVIASVADIPNAVSSASAVGLTSDLKRIQKVLDDWLLNFPSLDFSQSNTDFENGFKLIDSNKYRKKLRRWMLDAHPDRKVLDTPNGSGNETLNEERRVFNKTISEALNSDLIVHANINIMAAFNAQVPLGIVKPENVNTWWSYGNELGVTFKEAGYYDLQIVHYTRFPPMMEIATQGAVADIYVPGRILDAKILSNRETFNFHFDPSFDVIQSNLVTEVYTGTVTIGVSDVASVYRIFSGQNAIGPKLFRIEIVGFRGSYNKVVKDVNGLNINLKSGLTSLFGRLRGIDADTVAHKMKSWENIRDLLVHYNLFSTIYQAAVVNRISLYAALIEKLTITRNAGEPVPSTVAGDVNYVSLKTLLDYSFFFTERRWGSDTLTEFYIQWMIIMYNHSLEALSNAKFIEWLPLGRLNVII